MMGKDAQSPFGSFARLQEQGIRLFIVGGYAVNALGFTRHTEDADCLIVMDDLRLADRLLREDGWIMVRKEQTHARYMNPGRKPDTVDVLLVNETTFEKMWTKRVAIERRGVGFHVPELEHLFAMKFHAIRNQPERWGKDLLDIQELTKANPGVVSRDRLVELCRQFGPAQRIQEVLRFIYGPEH